MALSQQYIYNMYLETQQLADKYAKAYKQKVSLLQKTDRPKMVLIEIKHDLWQMKFNKLMANTIRNKGRRASVDEVYDASSSASEYAECHIEKIMEKEGLTWQTIRS
jgi:hypothetical protein